MDVLSTAHDFSNFFSCCETRTKNKRCRQVILVLTFILMTFDLATDWINWKQWSEVGGYNWHHLIFIFRTTFLCVVIVGTVIYTTETFTIVVKLFRIHTLETSDDENPSDERKVIPHQMRQFCNKQEMNIDEMEKSFDRKQKLDEGDKSSSQIVRDDRDDQEKTDEEDISSPGKPRENSKEQYKVREQNCIYRLTLLLLIFTGFFEDFPVVLVTFYTAASPTCGTPARQEVGSLVTMVTIISSMMNSLWTMIILLCELHGFQTFKIFCIKTCYQMSINYVIFKLYYKQYFIILSKILLLGFILLLFSGNFVMGMLTIAQITGSISLRPIGVQSPLYLTHSVSAGEWGPGLDGKRDEAMFIYFVVDLKFPHQIVLYDNEGNVKARSMWTNQMLNRLYIGQFEELSHLKEGTLTKAVPCSRVFPFVDKVEELQPLYNNISDCKLILNIRYYSANNNWNPFKKIFQQFNIRITIEWGFYLSDVKLCPWVTSALAMLRLNSTEVLTSDIKDDLIKYTCSSVCGDDANICDNAYRATFRFSWQRCNAHKPPRLYLAINDLKVADSCLFLTFFEYSQEFCNESWSGVQTVDVPQEIQDLYPQFITIPELYTFDEEHEFLVPKYVCNELWNSSSTLPEYISSIFNRF